MQSVYKKRFQDVPNELDETWRDGALLGGMAEGGYDRLELAKSYKFAGDILVEKALSGAEPYELIYPILFNYRHSIELYLKIVVKSTNNHNIQRLVSELTEYTTARYNLELPQWFKDRILDFDEFDPRATAFRYDDIGIKSKKSGDVGEFWVELPYLKKVMDTLQIIFQRLIQDL